MTILIAKILIIIIPSPGASRYFGSRSCARDGRGLLGRGAAWCIMSQPTRPVKTRHYHTMVLQICTSHLTVSSCQDHHENDRLHVEELIRWWWYNMLSIANLFFYNISLATASCMVGPGASWTAEPAFRRTGGKWVEAEGTGSFAPSFVEEFHSAIVGVS